jgi:hypothetical protein
VILDHAPALVEELVNSDFDTASPFTLKFDENTRGQRVFSACAGKRTPK